MKIKIFTEYYEDKLCRNFNDWVLETGSDIIDIKYSNISDSDGQCFYTILVMYRE